MNGQCAAAGGAGGGGCSFTIFLQVDKWQVHDLLSPVTTKGKNGSTEFSMVESDCKGQKGFNGILQSPKPSQVVQVSPKQSQVVPR